MADPFVVPQFVEQVIQLVWSSFAGDTVDRLTQQVGTIEYVGMFSEFMHRRTAESQQPVATSRIGGIVTLRAMTKAMVETAIGRDVKTIEPNAVALIDPQQRHQAWFCYDLQLQWFLEASAIDLVIDAGANEGQFGRRLRRFYGGDILSFEPVSSAFAELARVSHDDLRWNVYQFALGSADSTATIHVCSDTSFSSLLLPNEFSQSRFHRSAVETEETVRIQRLDCVLPQIHAEAGRKRVFLKLDTQGFDLEVFKGLGTYADQVSLIQAEVSLVPIYDGMPHWTRSIEAYEQAGFSVAGMFPVTRTKSGRVIEYDCLLLRDRA